MNTSARKIVSFQEAFEVSRQLRWRMEYLEECGAKGVCFALEIEEELAAKAVLARKFNAKAKANALDIKIQARVERIEAFIAETKETIH
ncbi:hypothetical protein ACWIUA_00345 [Ursidibacter sp. B-7004-1]